MEGTISDHIERVYRRAGSKKLWSVVRRAASLLSKVVDSLAPSITNVLVQGKQVSICFSGIHLITVAKVWGRTLNFKFCIL
jgi:phosphorylase kinase alpha/beta subunit